MKITRIGTASAVILCGLSCMLSLWFWHIHGTDPSVIPGAQKLDDPVSADRSFATQINKARRSVAGIPRIAQTELSAVAPVTSQESQAALTSQVSVQQAVNPEEALQLSMEPKRTVQTQSSSFSVKENGDRPVIVNATAVESGTLDQTSNLNKNVGASIKSDEVGAAPASQRQPRFSPSDAREVVARLPSAAAHVASPNTGELNKAIKPTSGISPANAASTELDAPPAKTLNSGTMEVALGSATAGSSNGGTEPKRPTYWAAVQAEVGNGAIHNAGSKAEEVSKNVSSRDAGTRTPRDGGIDFDAFRVWWSMIGRRTGRVTLNYVGEAAFDRAIVLMFSNNVTAAAGEYIQVLDSHGKKAPGAWEVGTKNPRMLIFKAHPGRYILMLSSDLVDASGNPLGENVDGPVYVH